MKKHLLFYSAIIILQSAIVHCSYAQAALNIKPSEQEVKEWMQKPEHGFEENKGQVADAEGKPAPYVLYKVQVPNMIIWVTNTGLTYQFLKSEDEGEREREERESAKKEMREPKSLSTKDAIAKVDEEEERNWNRVDMVLKGANIRKENITAEGDITQGDVSFYLAHCPDGIFNVKKFSKITVKDVYPGIDWVLTTASAPLSSEKNKNGDVSGFKHEFIVHANADANQVKLIYEGSGKMKVKDNAIHFENKSGEVTEGKLLCYQGSETNVIASNYIVAKNVSPLYAGAGNNLTGNETASSLSDAKKKVEKIFSSEIGIALGNYDNTKTLVIDPQLWWASFYGGDGVDGPQSIDCDANGFVFVSGYVTSATATFPSQNWGGAYNGGGFNAVFDAYILRFSNTGALTWVTYYGGSGYDKSYSIHCDNSNNVYVTGYTVSTDFPLRNLGGAYNQNANAGSNDIFILRFTASTGARTWATYYGGTASDKGYAISTDALDNVYVTGYTDGSLPLMNWAGAYNQPTFGGNGDNFILRFAVGTCARTWATYYGGSDDDEGYAIAADGADNIYFTGYTSSTDLPLQTWGGAYNQPAVGGAGDAYIVRFTASTGARTWATYFGGTGDESSYSMACSPTNSLYVTGITEGSFPLQNRAGAYNQPTYGGGAYDAFLLQFTPAGVLNWSTYYGGSGTEGFESYDNLKIDACGNVYTSFYTTSTDIFTQGSAGCGTSYLDASYNGDNGAYGDIFIIKMNTAGAVLWATYFGGNGDDFRESLTIDNNANMFMVGEWKYGVGGPGTDNTYPRTNPGGAYYDASANGEDDAFICKFIQVVPTFTQSQVDATGCNCNGSATISLSCGDPNYSFVWSNGSQALDIPFGNNTVTGLCAGSYTVTATSNCNQTTTAIFTISGGAGGLTLTSTSTNATCTGLGTATVNASGGTTPYTYSWSNGQTTQTATGLAAGTYTVTVTDFVGCISTHTVTITSSGTPTASVTTVSNVLCNGGSTGSASASATGGTLPYTYSWSNGQTTSTATGLSAANYTVTVTDSSGCITTQTVTITQPTVLTTTTSSTIDTCGLNNGTTTANPTGGTGPYSYNWNPSAQTTQTATGLVSGSYSVIVTDANGCTTTATVTVASSGIVATVGPDTTVCPGQPVTLTASGGTNYSWSTGETTGSITVINDVAMTYTVIVSSGSASCADTLTVSVGIFPAPAVPTFTQNGDTLFATQGYAGYQWYDSSIAITGATNYYYVATHSGNYNIIVTDANGCQVGAGILNVIASLTPALSKGEGVAVYPNPARDEITVYGLPFTVCELEIYNSIGQVVYSATPNFKPQTSNLKSQTINCKGFAEGIYILTVQTKEETISRKFVIEK